MNLAGVDRDEVARGDVIVAAAPRAAAAPGGAAGGAIAATYRVDVALTWATPEARPDGGARVGVHHGTRESAARLVELGGRFFQLRLEAPIVPAAGDRLVIRSLAPPDTLGGGVVLDASPRRHGPSRDLLARLARLERGEPEPEAPAPRPAPKPQEHRSARARSNSSSASRRPATSHRSTRSPSCSRRSENTAVSSGSAPRCTSTPTRSTRSTTCSSPRSSATAQITLAGLRDELKTSRKYAQAYLEHFDGAKVTLRRGDARVLRRKRAS